MRALHTEDEIRGMQEAALAKVREMVREGR